MSKFFLHAFIAGKNCGEDYADSIGVVQIDEWEVKQIGIEVRTTKDQRGPSQRCWWTFAPGNRFYIVENHGQYWEPNGDIIWRNEDGAQGDEKVAA